MSKAVKLGCKTLKISGGGEPLLYDSIISLLCLAKYYHLYVQLQTNGDDLSFLYWKFCDDVRVSLSDERHLESRPAHYAHGFSYVVTAKPDYDNLSSVVGYAIANDKYVKVTQDDTDLDNVPDIEEIKSHLFESPNLTFWDAKDYHIGQNPCPECMRSPLLGADGYYYPCCRSQYAKGKDLRNYDASMRLGQDIESIILVPSVGTKILVPNVGTNTGYDGSECTRCYYQ